MPTLPPPGCMIEGGVGRRRVHVLRWSIEWVRKGKTRLASTPRSLHGLTTPTTVPVQAIFLPGLSPYEIRGAHTVGSRSATPMHPARHERHEEQESYHTRLPSLGARRVWRSGTVHPRTVSHHGSLLHPPALLARGLRPPASPQRGLLSVRAQGRMGRRG